MADVTHIYGNEIVDAAARQDVSNLKEDYTDILNSAYVTDTASGAIASFPDGADDVPVKSLTVNIEPVQSGSGDPSPDNVRPISGHTQAVVTRCGKNLLTKPFVFRPNPSNLSDCFYLKSGTYSISFESIGSATSWRFGISLFDADGNPLSDNAYRPNPSFNYLESLKMWWLGADTSVKSQVITIAKDCYARFWFGGENTTDSMVANGAQLELGSTASTYEPYNGQTYEIDLDGTRYGGTLDVTSGVLTVDMALVDMGMLNWVISDTSMSGIYRMFSTSISDVVKRPESNSVIANTVCSTYKTVAADSTYLNTVGVAITRGGAVSVYDERFNQASDTESFKAAMSGQYMTYELAEPFTVQLTAEEVTTLLGQNNIWSDAGMVDVEYRADTKLYIEKLTAPTEDDLIADHAIAANTFFMVGNNLYRATTAIASGATITVGTNATKLSLSDALNALS